MDRPKIELHDTVKLRPNGAHGKVLRFPRKVAGQPPLATVEWESGNTSIHDRRDLILVEKAKRNV